MKSIARGILLLVLAIGLIACGGDSEPTPAPPEATGPVEVQVKLTEFKIESSITTFSPGVTYRFVIENIGALEHDWMIMPRGETDHSLALIFVDESELPPGGSVTREFTFTEAGQYEMACHVPGHYEAGMKLDITVQ